MLETSYLWHFKANIWGNYSEFWGRTKQIDPAVSYPSNVMDNEYCRKFQII